MAQPKPIPLHDGALVYLETQQSAAGQGRKLLAAETLVTESGSSGMCCVAIDDKSFEQFRRDFVESCVFRVRRKTSFEKLQTNDGNTLAFGDKLVLEHVFSERIISWKNCLDSQGVHLSLELSKPERTDKSSREALSKSFFCLQGYYKYRSKGDDVMSGDPVRIVFNNFNLGLQYLVVHDSHQDNGRRTQHTMTRSAEACLSIDAGTRFWRIKVIQPRLPRSIQTGIQSLAKTKPVRAMQMVRLFHRESGMYLSVLTDEKSGNNKLGLLPGAQGGVRELWMLERIVPRLDKAPDLKRAISSACAGRMTWSSRIRMRSLILNKYLAQDPNGGTDFVDHAQKSSPYHFQAIRSSTDPESHVKFKHWVRLKAANDGDDAWVSFKRQKSATTLAWLHTDSSTNDTWQVSSSCCRENDVFEVQPLLPKQANDYFFVTQRVRVLREFTDQLPAVDKKIGNFGSFVKVVMGVLHDLGQFCTDHEEANILRRRGEPLKHHQKVLRECGAVRQIVDLLDVFLEYKFDATDEESKEREKNIRQILRLSLSVLGLYVWKNEATQLHLSEIKSRDGKRLIESKGVLRTLILQGKEIKQTLRFARYLYRSNRYLLSLVKKDDIRFFINLPEELKKRGIPERQIQEVKTTLPDFLAVFARLEPKNLGTRGMVKNQNAVLHVILGDDQNSQDQKRRKLSFEEKNVQRLFPKVFMKQGKVLLRVQHTDGKREEDIFKRDWCLDIETLADKKSFGAAKSRQDAFRKQIWLSVSLALDNPEVVRVLRQWYKNSEDPADKISDALLMLLKGETFNAYLKEKKESKNEGDVMKNLIRLEQSYFQMRRNICDLIHTLYLPRAGVRPLEYAPAIVDEKKQDTSNENAEKIQGAIDTFIYWMVSGQAPLYPREEEWSEKKDQYMLAHWRAVCYNSVFDVILTMVKTTMYKDSDQQAPLSRRLAKILEVKQGEKARLYQKTERNSFIGYCLIRICRIFMAIYRTKGSNVKMLSSGEEEGLFESAVGLFQYKHRSLLCSWAAALVCQLGKSEGTGPEEFHLEEDDQVSVDGKRKINAQEFYDAVLLRARELERFAHHMLHSPSVRDDAKNQMDKISYLIPWELGMKKMTDDQVSACKLIRRTPLADGILELCLILCLDCVEATRNSGGTDVDVAAYRQVRKAIRLLAIHHTHVDVRRRDCEAIKIIAFNYLNLLLSKRTVDVLALQINPAGPGLEGKFDAKATPQNKGGVHNEEKMKQKAEDALPAARLILIYLRSKPGVASLFFSMIGRIEVNLLLKCIKTFKYQCFEEILQLMLDQPKGQSSINWKLVELKLKEAKRGIDLQKDQITQVNDKDENENKVPCEKTQRANEKLAGLFKKVFLVTEEASEFHKHKFTVIRNIVGFIENQLATGESTEGELRLGRLEAMDACERVIQSRAIWFNRNSKRAILDAFLNIAEKKQNKEDLIELGFPKLVINLVVTTPLDRKQIISRALELGKQMLLGDGSVDESVQDEFLRLLKGGESGVEFLRKLEYILEEYGDTLSADKPLESPRDGKVQAHWLPSSRVGSWEILDSKQRVGDRALPTLVVQFLKNCCENHHSGMQRFLNNQGWGEAEVYKVSLVSSAAELLNTLLDKFFGETVDVVDRGTVNLCKAIVSFLSESVQGPCIENQDELSSKYYITPLYAALKRMSVLQPSNVFPLHERIRDEKRPYCTFKKSLAGISGSREGLSTIEMIAMPSRATSGENARNVRVLHMDDDDRTKLTKEILILLNSFLEGTPSSTEFGKNYAVNIECLDWSTVQALVDLMNQNAEKNIDIVVLIVMFLSKLEKRYLRFKGAKDIANMDEMISTNSRYLVEKLDEFRNVRPELASLIRVIEVDTPDGLDTAWFQVDDLFLRNEDVPWINDIRTRLLEESVEEDDAGKRMEIFLRKSSILLMALEQHHDRTSTNAKNPNAFTACLCGSIESTPWYAFAYALTLTINVIVVASAKHDSGNNVVWRYDWVPDVTLGLAVGQLIFGLVMMARFWMTEGKFRISQMMQQCAEENEGGQGDLGGDDEGGGGEARGGAGGVVSRGCCAVVTRCCCCCCCCCCDCSWRDTARYAGALCQMQITWYFALYLATSILAVAHSPFWSAFNLLEIVRRWKPLRTVLASVERWKQMLWTLAMGLIVMFVYTVIVFWFFTNGGYRISFGDDDIAFVCDTLWGCTQRFVDLGFRTGIHPLRPDETTGRDYYIPAVSVLFDLSYSLFVNVILVSIITGIIIDTFTEKREKTERTQNKVHNWCFVCGKVREAFEMQGRGFRHHITCEHNVWAYVEFMYYLEKKEKDELTGMESDLRAKIMKGDFQTWLPIDKAIVLT